MGRGLGDDPQVALRVEVAVVDRRRDALLRDRHDRREGLERAGRAHHVAGHRLRAADRERRADCAAARSPNTVQIASASRLSPSGVEVPWGLIRSTSSAGTPRRSRAIFIARAEPIPPVDRLDHVPAVGRRAVADDLGVDLRAARLRQLEVLEEQRRRRPRRGRTRRGSCRTAARRSGAARRAAACPSRACS